MLATHHFLVGASPRYDALRIATVFLMCILFIFSFRWWACWGHTGTDGHWEWGRGIGPICEQKQENKRPSSEEHCVCSKHQPKALHLSHRPLRLSHRPLHFSQRPCISATGPCASHEAHVDNRSRGEDTQGYLYSANEKAGCSTTAAVRSADPAAESSVCLHSETTPEHFYTTQHRQIYFWHGRHTVTSVVSFILPVILVFLY